MSWDLEIKIRYYLREKDNELFLEKGWEPLPFIEVYRDGERVFIYYYPEETKREVRERLKRKGLTEFEISKVLKVISTFSDFYVPGFDDMDEEELEEMMENEEQRRAQEGA